MALRAACSRINPTDHTHSTLETEKTKEKGEEKEGREKKRRNPENKSEHFGIEFPPRLGLATTFRMSKPKPLVPLYFRAYLGLGEGFSFTTPWVI